MFRLARCFALSRQAGSASAREKALTRQAANRKVLPRGCHSFIQSCSWRPSISQRTCLASYKSISASTQRPCVAARFIWRRNRASRASSNSNRRATLFAALTFMQLSSAFCGHGNCSRSASMMGSGMCRHSGHRSRMILKTAIRGIYSYVLLGWVALRWRYRRMRSAAVMGMLPRHSPPPLGFVTAAGFVPA